jgi:hypothetical protein
VLVCFAVLFLAGCAEEEIPTVPGGGGAGVSMWVPKRFDALRGSSVLALGSGKAALALTEEDEVRVVTLATGASRRVNLPSGSQPTHLASAGAGAFVVTLPGTGSVARVVNGTVREIRSACDEPRGVAWDEENQAMLVACAGGELVTVTDGVRSVVQVGEELRDVFRVQGTTWVTTFRSAELLALGADGQVVTRLSPPKLGLTRPGATKALTFTPHVAWRAVVQGTRVAMVHQLHLDDEVSTLTAASTRPTPPPYYGSGETCGTSVVTSALTTFDLDGRKVLSTTPVFGALPVDVSADETTIALVTLGNGSVVTTNWGLPSACQTGTPAGTPTPVGVGLVEGHVVVLGHDGAVVEPLTGVVVAHATAVPLDDARAFFHRQSPSGVACASCHAEGHDDGHTWNFQGARVRTQDLSGGLSDTAPFHWKGELRDLDAVLHVTFESRMGGTLDPRFSTTGLRRWLDSLPARPGRPEPQPTGEALFQSAGCSGCHSGPQLTSNKTVDVGTGGAFQVPSLKGVRWRGPWMHDGCAKTLADRFNPECGGAHHGSVAPADVPELVKYLESL